MRRSSSHADGLAGSCFMLLCNCSLIVKWRQVPSTPRLHAANGLDRALTRLMWLVQTYWDRPTIFHANRLILQHPARSIWKTVTRIDRRFSATIDAIVETKVQEITYSHRQQDQLNNLQEDLLTCLATPAHTKQYWAVATNINNSPQTTMTAVKSSKYYVAMLLPPILNQN